MKEALSYVALGSNLGERSAALESAVSALRAAPEVTVLDVSSFHRTAPTGGPAGQRTYLNAALSLRTELAPLSLLRLLLSIEARFGRDRANEVRWGPRRLDLDLLLHGERHLASVELTLPHPRMEDRLFVLEPLAEIAPGLRLPRSGVRIERRIEQLESLSGVSLRGERV